MRGRWAPLALAVTLAPATIVINTGPAVASIASTDGAVSDTPANQPLLDALADQAEATAGDALGGVAVDLARNQVDVYLVPGPRAASAKAELLKLHPGYYVFHTAAHSRTAVLAAAQIIAGNLRELGSASIQVASVEVTLDGHLSLGVLQGDLWEAGSLADQLVGPGLTTVHRVDHSLQLTSYRYNDSAPWNGGDGIGVGTNAAYGYCSTGIPVHNTSSGARFLLTAAHCFEGSAGVGTPIYNMIKGVASSNKDMGSLYASDESISYTTLGNPTLDSALVAPNGGSSRLDFDCAWNCSGTATQVDAATNHIGDQVCSSGAYEGQICGIVLTNYYATLCLYPTGASMPSMCSADTWEGQRNDHAVIVGEGDSGGPVYSWSGSGLLARGMIDSQNWFGACPSSSADYTDSKRTCGRIMYFIDMHAIMSHWGVAPNTT